MTELEQTPVYEEAPDAPIQYRSSIVADVNFAKRIIEFIAAPYDEVGMVMWRGEPWRELFLRGAWDGIEKRQNLVRVNRDHDKKRTVGKIVDFFPSRKEGLVGVARISQTPLGDETLALADDEVLGASVGYAARPVDVDLDKVSRLRRVKRAFMDHLALLPDPTWESAAVLSVRHAGHPLLASEMSPLVTPALDELIAWQRARQPRI